MNRHWKRLGMGMALGLSAAGLAWAGDPLAEVLMERVRQSLPEVPLELEATIRVLSRTGRPVETVRAGAQLSPQEGGRTARYTVYDGFGTVQEEMTVELGAEGAVYSYAQGDPPRAAPLPDLFGPVAGTQISWMELSFSFFWWPGPRIVGTEKVANRWECQIIEIDRPTEAGAAGEGWSHIRLWVAPAYNAVVRGEAWRDGRAWKRFEVKSVKKLRQVYMIGDMDVHDLVSGKRSRLVVGRMRMRSPDYTDEELEEFNAPVAW